MSTATAPSTSAPDTTGRVYITKQKLAFKCGFTSLRTVDRLIARQILPAGIPFGASNVKRWALDEVDAALLAHEEAMKVARNTRPVAA